jgi:hypothetical protein
VPACPVYLRDGLREGDLLTVLGDYDPPADAPPEGLWLVRDDPGGLGVEVREDVPLDFARRRFGLRTVRVERLAVSPATRK